MNHARRFNISRGGALFLALMMLLSPVMGLAQPPLDPITIAASWTGADGSAQTANSVLVTYEGYQNTYWLYLPMEAVQADAAVTVTDNYPGTYPGGFTLPQGQPLSMLGYIDAGAGLSQQPVYFQALDANNMPMADFTLYVSTLAPTPEPPQPVETPVPQPLNIPVRYVDQNTGAELIPASSVSAPVGQTTPVYAQPIDGYTPTQNEQAVTVDANGMANVSEVVFYYTANATPVPQPLNIPVRYVDQNTGAELMPASSVSAPVGQTTPVYAQPIDGYTPTQNEQAVTVDANGMANVSEVVFYYTANATPVPQPLNIPVRYVDQNTGAELIPASSVSALVGQTTPVYAQPIDGYTPTQNEQAVTVDASGMPNMAEVIFYYIANATPVPEPLNIPVRYVDQNTGAELIPASSVSALVGQTTPVYAQPIDGYTPTQNEQAVTVDANGMANMAEVIFYYTANATPVPEPLNIPVRYVDQNTGAELMPASSVSAPVGQTTPVYAQPIDGYTPTQNEQAVTVDANGMANVAEVVFYYTANATAVPEPTQTPAPAQIPVYYKDRDSGADVASAQSVTAEAGKETQIYAQPADLQAGYTLADGVDVQTVSVDENGVATPAEITFLYVHKALPVLTIRFVDETTGQDVAPSKTMSLTPGEHDILAEPDNLPELYAPSGPTTQRVTATEDMVSPDTLTFFYKPKVSEPVDVPVRFVDRDGNPVATAKVFQAADGTNTIKAEPDDLQTGYQLIEGEPDTKYVIVSNNTADPAEVLFHYEFVETPVVTEVPTPTPEPAPKVAIVTIYYRDQFGTSLINPPETVTVTEGQPATVAVDPSKLDSRRYELTSATEQVVTVDSSGIASPEQVVFLYKDLSVDRTAEIQVKYLDQADGEVAPAETVPVKLGDNTITSKHETAPEGFEAQQPTSQTVNLSPEGVLTPSEVVFRFTKVEITPSPVPEPTAFPFTLKEMDAYAYPRSNEINFRSEPLASGTENIIRKVGAQDLMHITGSLVNNRDEVWYFGTIDGVEGFMKQDVTRILTEDETAAALGYTPAPTTGPTPSPTPVADGVALNIWGVANANSLRFRAEPSTKAKVVADLKKGDKVFVYQQQTSEEEKWYAAVFNGKEGFVMSSFIDLMSKQESDKLQTSLPSPAPVRTLPPLATEKPVATTQAPATATPVATTMVVTASPQPTASAAPAPYRGYALTTRQVPLRTGISESSEFILATLPQNALVLISGQAYVEGTAWNHVEALSIKQTGYIPDSALRRIDPQEAQPYLNALQTTPSPTPVRITQQVTGFAITIGSNVPMRSYFNTNAEIIALLGMGEVVQVLGQEAQDNITWHVVQFNGLYGFIRTDQLRMLNPTESQSYLNSLRATLPPAVTPAVQLTQNSLSSYGYVNTDKVRLRKEANTNSAYLKMMDKNAFALVLGSVIGADGSTWYKINQAGTEGFVMGSYFTVLPMNQLTTFLQSSDYLNANTGASSSGGKPASQITAVEDFNAQVWKNPTLAQASYEPFNPLGSPTPQVEAIMTPSPEPSETPEATVSFGPLTTETPVSPSSSFPTGLLAIGLLAVLGGGGYYAYYMYKQNQQRAAARNAKRRQQQQQQQQAGGPQTRPAQTQGTAAYQPPRPRTPGAPGQTGAAGQPGQPPQAGAQGTQRPLSQQPPQGGPQGTSQYRPAQPGVQGTAQYRLEQTGTQGTTQYRPTGQVPPTAPGQAGTNGQAGASGTPAAGTTQYRPVTQQGTPGQTGMPPAQAAGTTQFRPLNQPPIQGTPAQPPLSGQQAPLQDSAQTPQPTRQLPVQKADTQAPTDKPVESAADRTVDAAPEKPGQAGETKPSEGEASRRRRRADRHDDEPDA